MGWPSGAHGTAMSPSYHGSVPPIGSGGGRAGRRQAPPLAGRDGSRMRRIAVGSSMTAISSRRSPQRGHEHVEPEAALHQIRPEPIRARRDGRGSAMPRSRARRRLRRSLGLGPGQPRAPRRSRAEHAVIQQQVDAWPGRQRREPLQQLDRIEDEVRRPVRPPVATGSSTGWRVCSFTIRNTSVRDGPDASVTVQPVSCSATTFMNVTRPVASVGMTASPMLESVTARSGYSSQTTRPTRSSGLRRWSGRQAQQKRRCAPFLLLTLGR